MTQAAEDRTAQRALTLKKLLDKANAKGVTDEERDAYNAMASKLMLKWGIEEAQIADADRTYVEEIIQVIIVTTFPKGYSFEGAMVTVEVAKALNCSGYFTKRSSGATDATVVGFKSDVTLVQQLVASIALQCHTALEREMRTTHFPSYMNGTDKFNHRRSFVRGFAKAVGQKLADSRRQFVEESTPGTDVALVDRKSKVDTWVNQNMRLGSVRPRKATPNGLAAGRAAGQRADVGQTRVGGSGRGIER